MVTWGRRRTCTDRRAEHTCHISESVLRNGEAMMKFRRSASSALQMSDPAHQKLFHLTSFCNHTYTHHRPHTQTPRGLRMYTPPVAPNNWSCGPAVSGGGNTHSPALVATFPTRTTPSCKKGRTKGSHDAPGLHTHPTAVWVAVHGLRC